MSLNRPKTWADVLWLTLTALLALWAQVNGFLVLTLGAAGIALVLGTVALPLSEEHIRRKGDRIREALRLSDISLSKAALYVYGDERRATDLAKALHCDRALDAWKLERLPDEFHRHLALLELRDRGLPAYAVAFSKITALFDSGKATA